MHIDMENESDAWSLDVSDLVQPVYKSAVNQNEFSTDTIPDILRVAQKNNVELGITGMLLCDYQYFLQELEGPKTEVEALYQKIAKDSRHIQVEQRVKNEIQSRQFENWSMGFYSLGSADKLESSALHRISGDDALSLLLDKARVNGNRSEPEKMAD